MIETFMHRIHVAISAFALFIMWVFSVQAGNLILVDEGGAKAVIIKGEGPSVDRAATDLQNYILKSTGVTIPLAESASEGKIGIYIGNTSKAQSMGLNSSKLLTEQFRIKSTSDSIVLVGRDGKPGAQVSAPASVWAVDHLADYAIGVRWLWPGELGTYVPKMQTISVPDNLDITWRPVCEHRDLAMRFTKNLGQRKNEGVPTALSQQKLNQVANEAKIWGEHQRLGLRERIIVSHSFEDWWRKYSKTNPEFFAKTPPGKQFQQPYKKEGCVKLCNSNEAAIQQMVKEWKNAGSPEIWGAAPNDSGGYCVCEKCLAMDEAPPGRSIEQIFTGKEVLTIRHVKWWNRIIKEFKKHDPNIRMKVIAYGAYKTPPPDGMALDKAYIVSMVCTYLPGAQKQWLAWKQGGASIGLRPNWWHSGTHGPFIPYRQQAEFTKFAIANNMIGFRQDELKGAWGVQGINYYTFARLNVRPELTADDILNEYVSAFGSAREVIREYFGYWEKYSQKTAIPALTGGYESLGVPSLYEDAVKKHKVHPHPLNGSFKALEYMYPDSSVEPAFKLLDQADEMAKNDIQEVKDRIQFLRDGLKHMVLTRDVITLGYKLQKNKDKELITEFTNKSEQLRQMRGEFSLRHVVWGDNDYGSENRRHIPTFPRGKLKYDDLEGF
jgi:hypothetical protein